jgi:hypothetical protein
MFRPISGLFAAVAALLLLGAAPSGALYITTLPSGADVWIDGTYVGHSPLVLDALSAGRHSVSLTKTGWAPQDLDVSIVPDTTALSSVQLLRAPSRSVKWGPGTFAIKGLAARGVTVDGIPVKPEKNGTYIVASGTHVVVVQVAGGKATRTITVYPDMRTDLVLRGEDDARSPVVAPAADYLPSDAVRIDGSHVSIKFHGHEVAADVGSTSYRVDGRSATFDSAPTVIGTKLYLPLELLTQLTADTKAK